MRPQFRFTLTHQTLGSEVISEPEGWKNLQINLERDMTYHSLVENYEIPLTFYGNNGEVDGGYDYLDQVIAIGKDEEVEILIEIRFWNDDYETYFEGQLDISEYKRIDFRKLQIPIIRNNLWARFMSRRSTPVTIGASTSLDGGALTAPSPTTLTLPGQAVRQEFERQTDYNDANEGLFEYSSAAGGTTNYLIWGNAYNILDEISERFEYGTQISSEVPTDVYKYIWKVDYAGPYRLQAGIRYYFVLSASRTYTITWYYRIRSEGALGTETQIGSNQSGTATSWADDGVRTLDVTLNLNAGDEIYIYGKLELDSAVGTVTYFPDYDSDLGSPFDPIYTSLSLTADTIYEDTTAEVFQIGQVANSILTQITSINNVLQSDYLEETDECGYEFALTKGLQVRGYTFAEKPFQISFDDWWRGADPLFNLGLGYEETGNSPLDEVIRIEPKEHFYQIDSVLTLTGVNNIEVELDKSLLYNKIEVGFEQWEAEAFSGLDDPQTRRSYRTRFKVFGESLSLLSSFYAASIGIEQTRRNRKEEGRDWRLDEEVMIIATQADFTEVELFDSGVSGLLNSDTRYNVRLTPAQSLSRWLVTLSGQLYEYDDEYFYYSKGEGNVGMSWGGDGCDSASDEDADIEVPKTHLFLPIIYSFIHSLTWEEYKLIRANKNKSITVSWVDKDGVTQSIDAFIKKLLYSVNESKAQWQVWPVIETAQPYSLELEIHEAVPGTCTWDCEFTDSVTTETLSATDDGAVDTFSLVYDSVGDLEIYVYKTSNIGISQGSGQIQVWVDGVMDANNPTFSNLQNVGSGSGFTINLTGLNGGELIEVRVYEGTTP